MADVPAPRSLRVGAGPTRKTPVVALGLLIVLGSGLAFAIWADSLGEREQVVAAAHDIPAGATIGPSDLTAVGVAVDGHSAVVPAAELESLVGQVARADMASGTLIAPGQLGDTSSVPPGRAIVGLAVETIDLPVPGLRAGDRVQVVAASSAELADGDRATGLLTVADVYAVSSASDTEASMSVSLVVPEPDAVEVAEAAAADRIRLVLLPSAPDEP